MNLCKNCKHMTIINRECRLTGYDHQNPVNGKKYTFYSSCTLVRGVDGLCRPIGQNFEASFIFKIKLKINRILHYDFF